MAKLVTDVIASVNRKASIPNADKKFNITGTYESFIEDSMKGDVYPMLLKLNENFNVVSTIIALSGSTYPEGKIPLPRRCYSQAIREVKWRRNSTNGLVNIPQIALEDSDVFYTYGRSEEAYRGFYFLGDTIKLVGNTENAFANLDGELFLHYVPAPSSITQDATIEGDISNIAYSSGTTTITVSSVGTGLNTYIADSATKLVDIYRKDTGAILIPSVLVTRTGTSFATTGISEDFATQLEGWQDGGFPIPTGYDSNLILVPEKQTARTTIPDSLDEYLEASIVSKMMASIASDDKYIVAEKERKRIKDNLVAMLGDRIEGEPKKITNRRGIKTYTRRRNWWNN